MYPNMQKLRQITCVSDRKFWVFLQPDSSNVFQITAHLRDKSYLHGLMIENKVILKLHKEFTKRSFLFRTLEFRFYLFSTVYDLVEWMFPLNE